MEESSALSYGLVQTETINGCPGCGTSSSVTKSYAYMILNNNEFDPNQVCRLCVEDTQDSAGNPVYRIVYGADGDSRTGENQAPGYCARHLSRIQ